MTGKRTDCEAIHVETVETVRARMPDLALLQELAGFFKVMGDGTRIRLLWALEEHEMCVCDLAVLLDMTKSAVSHQLKALRTAKLVKFRREGKHIFYSLDDDHVKSILKTGFEHITH